MTTEMGQRGWAGNDIRRIGINNDSRGALDQFTEKLDEKIFVKSYRATKNSRKTRKKVINRQAGSNKGNRKKKRSRRRKVQGGGKNIRMTLKEREEKRYSCEGQGECSSIRGGKVKDTGENSNLKRNRVSALGWGGS